MKWSFTIARVAGIKVQVHLTFLIIVIWFALAYWQLEGTPRGAIEGAGFILALFFCVVLHELGHALTARRFGIKTHNITLLPVGGVASIESMSDDPDAEIMIALAGPAVSLFIALLLWVFLTVTGRLVSIEEIGVAGGPFLQRLMIANLIIAIFNLIPAFPMDGGRVLHALLARVMETQNATRIAAGIGQVIAIIFAVLGLMYNPFLFLIAVFIWIAAAGEAQTASIKLALSNVTAAQAMLTDFQTLEPHDTLAKAIELTLTGSQKDFPVLENGRVVGFLAQSDLLRGLYQSGEKLAISEAMQTKILDIRSGDNMSQVLDLMQRHPNGLVTVSERGRLIGIVNLDNVFELIRLQAALER